MVILNLKTLRYLGIKYKGKLFILSQNLIIFARARLSLYPHLLPLFLLVVGSLAITGGYSSGNQYCRCQPAVRGTTPRIT